MNTILASALVAAQIASNSPDLADGIRAVGQGGFEAAVLTLDAAARRLSAEPGKTAELAQAYLYLGVAYFGLGQETLARTKFRLALAQDPKLEPRPQEFSPKVLRGFDEARREVVSGKAIEREAKRGMGKKPWLILGVGAAGAAGATVLLTNSRANTPPTASFTIEPQGVAITGVTELLFRASATDPEGDPLSYNWQFGDGNRNAGAVATHRYQIAGTFTVTLSVSDGADTTDATGQVRVASMVARWRTTSGTFPGLEGVEITRQTHNWVDVMPIATGWDPLGYNGQVLASRHVSLGMSMSLTGQQQTRVNLNFVGVIDGSAQRMDGTLYCWGRSCPTEEWTESLVRQ